MIQPKVDIHDILRHIIDNMDRLVHFQNVTDNGDGTFTVESCSTLWLMENDTLDLNGETYVVKSVKPNVNFVVEGAAPFEPTEPFELPKPVYFHGTVRKTNAELIEAGEHNARRYPMIYCFEIFRETFNRQKSNLNDRVSELRLFFLGSAEKEDWLTETHYEKVVIPLRNMLESFVTYIDKNKAEFDNPDFEYETINHIDFGTFTNDQGKLQNLFDDHLSGVELDFSLTVRKDLTCKLFCGDC